MQVVLKAYMYVPYMLEAYRVYACMLVYALKHTRHMHVCSYMLSSIQWVLSICQVLEAYNVCLSICLRAYICLTDAYICSMYASGYTILPVWVYGITVVPFVFVMMKQRLEAIQS